MRHYTIDPVEINRRRKAYTTLITTLFLGSALSLSCFVISNRLILSGILGALAIILFVTRIGFFRWLQTFAQTKIMFTDTYLERVDTKSSKRCKLDRVRKIWIKRTVPGSTREIKLTLEDKELISITALQDFTSFEKDLKERIGVKVNVSEFREPIDYDHPLFYVIFGFLVGFLTFYGITLLSLVDSEILKWIQCGLVVFIAATGLFWIINRPLSRYGIKKPFVDRVFGIMLVVTGIALGIFTLPTVFGK